MRRLALVSLFSLILPGLALADITVSVAPTVTPSGPVFTWSYDAFLNGLATATPTIPGASCNDSTASACNAPFFTIYDVSGYVSGSASAPSGWDVSVQLVGLTPTGQTPDTGDSSSIPNITFFYTDAQITGPQDLGIFSLQSTSGNFVTGSYTQQTNSNPPGTREHGGGFTQVPAAASVPVPEPSSLVLVGAALFALAIGRKQFAGLVQEK